MILINEKNLRMLITNPIVFVTFTLDAFVPVNYCLEIQQAPRRLKLVGEPYSSKKCRTTLVGIRTCACFLNLGAHRRTLWLWLRNTCPNKMYKRNEVSRIAQQAEYRLTWFKSLETRFEMLKQKLIGSSLNRS